MIINNSMITFPTKLRTRTILDRKSIKCSKEQKSLFYKDIGPVPSSYCMCICCQMSVVTKVWWMVCHHVNWIHTIQGWCNVWDAALVQGWPIIHAFDPNHAKTWGQFNHPPPPGPGPVHIANVHTCIPPAAPDKNMI